jgi:acyl-CoA synthetase (NDP forming)
VIDYANDLGLGMSTFVSVGNKADISGNDLINYWETDDDTDLILLYLESFGNPRNFSRICRRVGKKKADRRRQVGSQLGRSSRDVLPHRSLDRGIRCHGGSLVHSGRSNPHRYAGRVVRRCLAARKPPPPNGKRVAVVTNAGGPGILCADALEAAGLEVNALPDDVQIKLREFLPSEASTVNPVDMIASTTPEQYRRAVDQAMKTVDVMSRSMVDVAKHPRAHELASRCSTVFFLS